ncbi:hypothetical protein LBMAG22_04800 [Bacteroidota bacterium]|nr:hypothetical protein LBMAG22_04800 [Bacteroidota bacterium]
MKLYQILIALFLSVSFFSCDKDDTPQATTSVNIVHASPDAPGVDLLVDNVKVNTAALNFPDATGYLKVFAGTRNIKVNATGTSNSVINANLTFAADKYYSVFAYNQLASIGAIVVEDNLTVPATGQAHIRFFHLSPNAPIVTVGTLSGATFTPVFANRSFETQATASANQNFTPVPAGTYTFDVQANGTSALTLPGIVLQAGKIYTVFAKGLVGGQGSQALGAQIVIHN